jgi:hypothetical protein
MRIEIEFIILEGVMICLCVLAQTVFHPGKYFPALASQGKHKHVRVKTVDDMEMEPLGSYEEMRSAMRIENSRRGSENSRRASPHENTRD